MKTYVIEMNKQLQQCQIKEASKCSIIWEIDVFVFFLQIRTTFVLNIRYLLQVSKINK